MPELNVLDPFPCASNRRLSPTDRLDGPGEAHLVRPYPACNHPLRYHAGAGLACHPLCLAQLLVLAGLHFAIDAFKNFLATRKPGWIVGPYLFDQFLHLISIGVVAFWIMSSPPPVKPLLPVSWAILSIGYLLATYVWYITERVLVHGNPSYGKIVQTTRWSRIILRGGLLTLGMLFFGLANTPMSWVILPPFSTPAGRLALLTDLAVVAVVLIFMRFAFSL